MKIKSIARQITLILFGLLLTFTSAKAQAPAYTNGDIFLGFRASGGTGSNQTYLVNIGQASTYRDATGVITLNVGNIAADLASLYGATWFDRSDLWWGVAGAVTPALGSDLIIRSTQPQSRIP